MDWDDECPWAPWVSLEDPIASLELDALFQHTPIVPPVAEELVPGDATSWVLRVAPPADNDAMRAKGVTGMGAMLGALVRTASVAARGESVGQLAGHEFWDALMEVSGPRVRVKPFGSPRT